MILNHLLELYYLERNPKILSTHNYFNKINNIQFLDTIYPEQLDWNGLSRNPNTYDLLSQNIDKLSILNVASNTNKKILQLVDFENLDYSIPISHNLSVNPSALYILEKTPQFISWRDISGNPGAMNLLKRNPENISYSGLCRNTHFEAIEMILRKPEHIDWIALSINPRAIKYLLANQEKINWDYFSINPSDDAVKFLQRHPDKICWTMLSRNRNPLAVDLTAGFILTKKRGLTQWINLSANPSATHVLIKNINHINWKWLCRNPTVWKRESWSPSNHKYFTPVQRHCIVLSYKFLITLIPQEIAYIVLSYGF